MRDINIVKQICQDFKSQQIVKEDQNSLVRIIDLHAQNLKFFSLKEYEDHVRDSEASPKQAP